MSEQSELSLGQVIHWAFNLNHNVRVKLTELGYQRLADLHNSYIGQIPKWEERKSEDYRSQADEDGYTRFQMWSFMDKFGDVTGLCKPSYYDLEILIDTKDIKPCV